MPIAIRSRVFNIPDARASGTDNIYKLYKFAVKANLRPDVMVIHMSGNLIEILEIMKGA